jgi:hypothetical protein
MHFASKRLYLLAAIFVLLVAGGGAWTGQRAGFGAREERIGSGRWPWNRADVGDRVANGAVDQRVGQIL